MRKFYVPIHVALLITSTSLFAYPQYEQPIQQVQEMAFDGLNFTYDDILGLLNDIESGKIEGYSEEKLEKISHLITSLAQQGMLPGDYAVNAELESDIAALHGEEDAASTFCKHKKDKEKKKKHEDKDKHKSFFTKVKDFVKKHKKVILIGTAVVVGAAIVVIAVAATGTAVAAATASAVGAVASNPHSPKSADTSQLETALEERIASFKETLAAEEHLDSDLPIEENIRTLGSLFAHQSTQELQQWHTTPSPFGHQDIDQRFSTDCASLYTTPQTDFNTLAYQTRGEQALAFGYYEQAVYDFGKAIDLNPSNPVTYLERGVAYFNLGQYDRSLNDYQHFVDQKPTVKEPFSLSSFTHGFAKGLPSGIYDSGEGSLLFLADLVQHPIHTGKQVFDSLVILKDLVKTQAWETIGETLSPQVHDLVVNWDLLSSYECGELAGYAFGRHGTDFFLPVVAAKAAKTCTQLAAVSKNLQLAEKILLLETVESVPNGVKLIEANRHTIVLAEELGMPVSTAGQLKRAGTLEKSVSATVENFTPELRQSFDHIKKAEEFLKPYRRMFMPEAQARELIHETGIKTFPRPTGISDNYRVRITKDGAGMEYVHPQHAHTTIRVMPGKPHSPYPGQQKPYVICKIDGTYFNKAGDPVKGEIIEAHIAVEEFDLLSIMRKIK